MIWTAERNQQQGQLVAGLYQAAATVPCDRRAVMVGGLPGADKAAVLAAASVDPACYLTASVAAILAELARRAMIPAVEDLSPMEAATLVHTEAQFLAKRVALRALADGRNLILDLSMASLPSVTSWISALRSAAYAITGLLAELDPEESVRRVRAAHRRGEEAYRQGRGLGGRYIPAHAIRALADCTAGKPPDDPAGDPAREPASDPAGSWFGGGEVTALIEAWRTGQLTRAQLAGQFRARDWPPVPPTCPPDLAVAKAAIDDPEPYRPGSFDDVYLAYDLGYLSDADYAMLAAAAASGGRPMPPVAGNQASLPMMFLVAGITGLQPLLG